MTLWQLLRDRKLFRLLRIRWSGQITDGIFQSALASFILFSPERQASAVNAAVAFAEWLSITYGSRGIKVSCLCPQGVNTAMLRGGDRQGIDANAGNVVRVAGAVLEPAQVADVVHDALVEERFFIFPHPEVGDYVKIKATEHERWLGGMRKLQRRVFGV